jgi:DNA repair exonuclease SbcCD ATPase subunit
MKHISLTALRLTGFRSFSQATTIEFSHNAGLKLITGDNQLEPRLGANGCGKSTIWDAACFALYGVSVKGLRASDLISDGQQQLQVAAYLTIDDQTHTIMRQAPPMRLFVDGQPAEQADVEALIKLSKARFLNSVIFGQATPLFIDLPVPARGDLLDEVLDLELWMRAADKAGEKHRSNSEELNTLRRSMAATQGQLEGLGDIARFDEQISAWDANKFDRINELLAEFDVLVQEHEALQGQASDKRLLPIDENVAKLDFEIMRAQHTRTREKQASINAELKVFYDQITFMEHNDNCPTCDQPITTEHLVQHNAMVKPHIDGLEKQLETVKLDILTTKSQLEANELSWRGLVRENQEKLSSVRILRSQAAEKKRAMDRLEQEIERLADQDNPFAAEAARVKAEHQRLTDILVIQRQEESMAVSRLAQLDFWRQGFKKVRLFCLDSVLRELDIETSNALMALGLIGWRIKFKTATETKSGTMRLGVQVDISPPNAQRRFEHLSGGESQRARLAVSLGLASLIQRWAGVRFNLEVFDEPTAWLSEQGVEDLLESLAARAADNTRAIWVCDHRALIYAGFSEIMNIVKDREGSRIV